MIRPKHIAHVFYVTSVKTSKIKSLNNPLTTMEHITHISYTACNDACHINEVHIVIVVADIFKHVAGIFIGIGNIGIAPPKNTLGSWIIPSISWDF